MLRKRSSDPPSEVCVPFTLGVEGPQDRQQSWLAVTLWRE